jgi:hypothetical protein
VDSKTIELPEAESRMVGTRDWRWEAIGSQGEEAINDKLLK